MCTSPPEDNVVKSMFLNTTAHQHNYTGTTSAVHYLRQTHPPHIFSHRLKAPGTPRPSQFHTCFFHAQYEYSRVHPNPGPNCFSMSNTKHPHGSSPCQPTPLPMVSNGSATRVVQHARGVRFERRARRRNRHGHWSPRKCHGQIVLVGNGGVIQHLYCCDGRTFGGGAHRV